MGRPDLALHIMAMRPELIGGRSAKALAVEMALWWADEDGVVLARQLDVADLTGFSERTVRDLMLVLRDAGVITDTAAIGCRFSLDQPAIPAGDDRQSPPVNRQRAPVPAILAAGNPRRPPAETAGRPAIPAGSPAKSAGPVSVQTSSLSPPPPGLTSKEGEDARASDRQSPPPAIPAGSEWQPLPVELKTLAWVERHALPLRMPDGTDLRPEWIAALRWLSPKEADEIRTAMVGDLPSAFRAAAAPWEPTRASRARHAAAMSKALEGAEEDAAREAAAAQAEREKAERAEIERKRLEDAQTGTYLEQARIVLAAVDADGERREAMDQRTYDIVAGLRAQVLRGRVLGATVGNARMAWNETKVRPVPPPKAAAPAAEPTPDRTFHGDHPAAPDRDAPIVVLDDDAPPVDEDPVVEVVRDHLKRLGLGGGAAGAGAEDAWLAHLVLAGAAMTSADAVAYLALATSIANQRGIVVLKPDDIPSAAMIAWAEIAGPAAVA